MTAARLMDGKIVVATGATSGIGKVAVARLAEMGARIVFVARDRARGEAVLAELRSLAPSYDHRLHLADLSRLAEVRGVVAAILAAEPRIDVLINNAGALFNHRQVTSDGLETTFATNHMAYFALTRGLLDRLKASAPARIVSTASAAHDGSKLDFDDLQSSRGYNGFRAYGRSKLCNILFTRELSTQLAGSGVTANCLHPGFVATRFGDASGGVVGTLIGVFKRFAITPEQGAETIVYLASSPAVAAASGGYYAKCAPVTPSAQARDAGAAARLWAASSDLAELPRQKNSMKG